VFQRQDLRIYKGETFAFDFPALNKDLTGYSSKIQFKPNVKRIEDVVLHEVTSISLGSDGVIGMRVEAAESSLFDFELGVYDIALTDLVGDISFPFSGLVVITG
jgi:hypothetical protein